MTKIFLILLIFILMFVVSLVILCLIPLNLILIYNKKLSCVLKIGFIKINLEKINKHNTKNSKKNIKINKNNKSKKIKFLSNINKISKFSKKIFLVFFDKINIKELIFILNFSQKDIFNSATKYGQVCSIVYPFFRYIICKKNIKNYKISVRPRFDLEKSDLYFKVNFRTNLLSIINIIFKLFGGNL